MSGPGAAGAPLLEVRGLRKRFGGVVATDDVTLDVHEGDVHALIGPNGAGKTSLIAQLSGSLMPDAGTIRFAGDDVTRLVQHARVARGLPQFVPGIAAADAFRHRVQPRQRPQERRHRGDTVPSRRAFHRGLPLAPDARRSHRSRERRPGGLRVQHRRERVDVLAELPQQSRLDWASQCPGRRASGR